MHIPSGFWKDGLGDVDVIAHAGVLHAFYLSIPSHDRVGHLVSEDGLNWKEAPAAIYTGDPGAFDDDQIWTMGVFAHGGSFFMLYTGVSMKERGKEQRVGLATSKDLFTWKKEPRNPVVCADARWYEAVVDEKHRVDWRDPWVFVEDGVMHGVIAARANWGPENRRGCAGYFVSRDGKKWEVKPPVCVPGNVYDFETPAIAKIKGRYYMTGIGGKESGAASTSVYRVADRLEGPYRRVGREDLLAAENLVFKPVVWKGETLYFHNLRGVADWDSGKKCTVTCLAPAKVAHVEADGELVLRSFHGWDAAHDGAQVVLDGKSLAKAGKGACGAWREAGGVLEGDAQSGYGAFLLDEVREAVILTARFQGVDSPEFGMVIRGDEKGDDGTFISLTPALGRVQVSTVEPFYKTPCAGVTYRWRGRRVVQEWHTSDRWGTSPVLQVVAYGPYVEVSVNGRVMISTVTMRQARGRVGVFAEDGKVGVRGLEIQALKAPACVAGCV
jgi:beta-fructofuranosidase